MRGWKADRRTEIALALLAIGLGLLLPFNSVAGAPSGDPTRTPGPPPTKTPKPTKTPRPTHTPRPSNTPTHTPTNTATPTGTPTSTLTPTDTPVPIGTLIVTNTPTSTPTPTPTATVTATPTVSGAAPIAATPTPGEILTASVLGVETTTSDAPSAGLEIQTVPPLEGIGFVLDERIYLSDAFGRILIPIGDEEWHLLEAVGSKASDRGVRVTFAQWCCGMEEGASRGSLLQVLAGPSGVRRLVAAFKLSYLVTPTFADGARQPIDPIRIGIVSLRSSLGGQIALGGTDPTWLVGGVARRAPGRIVYKPVQYSVESVTVDGSQLTLAGEQRFYPGEIRDWEIPLEFYSARLLARDALFGFPLGTAVSLEHPDGKLESYALGADGEVTLYPLVPGTYRATVQGAAGLSPNVPLSASRNQAVVLRVFSYLDFAVVFLILDLLALGLVLQTRRPVLSRLRVGAKALWRRPRERLVWSGGPVQEQDDGVVEVWYGSSGEDQISDPSPALD